MSCFSVQEGMPLGEALEHHASYCFTSFNVHRALDQVTNWERDLHFWTRTLHLTIYFQSQIAFGKWMELHSIKKNKTHTQQTKPTKYKPTLWKLFQQKPPTTLKVRRHNTKDTISIPSDYLWSSCPAGINRRVLFWWKTRNKVIETLYFNTLRADQNS